MAGFTPLHLAVLYGIDDQIKMLLDQGASPAAFTPQGDTPLHLILRSKSYVPIDDRLFLLEENPFGSEGFSHCHIACLFGKIEIVRSFLDRGLHPNMHCIRRPFRMAMKRRFHNRQWIGDTCLHLATRGGYSDIVQLLLERGADPNVCNASLYTPLHNATYDRQGSATKLLLQYGADVNARNCDDMTPLHVQCSFGYQRSDDVTALLGAGADINLVNRFGVSVLQDVIKVSIAVGPPLLRKHILSLREADCLDLTIGQPKLDNSIKWLEMFDGMTEFRKRCRCELERMSRVRLDARTTLRDVLHLGSRRLQRLADNNEKFGRIVAEEATLKKKKKKYPIYGYLVRLQYRRGVRIAEFKEAVLALQKLYACTAEYHNGLPEECAEMVLRYLTWADQGHLIQAVLR